jgi:hypothetical protein
MKTQLVTANITVSTSSLMSSSLRLAPFSEAAMSRSRKANLFSERYKSYIKVILVTHSLTIPILDVRESFELSSV